MKRLALTALLSVLTLAATVYLELEPFADRNEPVGAPGVYKS